MAVKLVNPACAGMIPGREPGHKLLARKPRVCGDDPVRATVILDTGSVNPACAGMIPISWYITVTLRVNPACAGMIRVWSLCSFLSRSKPRVCGDDPTQFPAFSARKW